MVTIPSVIKMFPTFGLVIFLLGINLKEIIHKEDRTILVSTETFIGVLFMMGKNQRCLPLLDKRGLDLSINYDAFIQMKPYPKVDQKLSSDDTGCSELWGIWIMV